MTDSSDVVRTLLNEVLCGPAPEAAYFLNPGDAGLLTSLDRLSAAQASAPAPGGASIAAHVDHLRYGLELLNRELAGERAFDDADYSASWRRMTVSDREWRERREQLTAEANRLREIVHHRRGLGGTDLLNLVAIVVHLAYHLGAIRQIDRATKGPPARD